MFKTSIILLPNFGAVTTQRPHLRLQRLPMSLIPSPRFMPGYYSDRPKIMVRFDTEKSIVEQL
jgi:hypothetical protein